MLRAHYRYPVVITLAFLVLSSTACQKNEPQAAAGGREGGAGRPGGGAGGGAANLPARQVKVAQAQARALVRTVEAPGTLAADEEATLSFKVPGRVAQLRVDLGSPIRKGQLIAQLETLDFKARVEQSEAALQQARVRLGLSPQGDDDRVNLENTALVRQARAVLEEEKSNRERAIQLVNQGVQPRAELDRVESAFKVADSRYQDAIEEGRNRQAVLLQRRTELQIARQQLAETALYAPFDGAVRERRVTIGEYFTGGTAVVTIVRLHPLRLRVEIPERDAPGIRPGQPVKVTVEGDANSYTGRIARLSPAFQEQSRTLIVEAVVDNQHNRLRPGSFAKAAVQTATTADVVTVPAAAIVTFAGIQKVFSIKDGKAVEHNVVVGRRESDWVELAEGLKANETVILSPGNLVSGQPVTVSP